MSNKTAYELRADLLSMAKDYLDRQHEANVELAKAMVKAGGTHSQDIIEKMEFYTPDQIISEATKLYEDFFVNGPKQSQPEE